MIKAAIKKIESFSTIDGPGIRTVLFFGGCNLRCKFCHNPETWNKGKENYTVEEIMEKILRNKPYFQNNGGITLSGGEPLLQKEFLIKLCKELKKQKIHIALDTAGCGNNNNKELLELVDLVLLDIKSTTKEGFKEITQTSKFQQFKNFLKEVEESKKEVWIRQVIIPNINDNKKYIKDLAIFLKDNLNNIIKVEFLPFHTMGFSKYKELKIKNPYQKKEAMDKEKCKQLEKYFYTVYQKES